MQRKERVKNNSNVLEMRQNKKLRRRLKGTKAVTLVALVVTIVVLLILAGVSIAMLSGKNGILNKATKAQITTELVSYKEQLELYKTEKTSENMDFEPESLTAGKFNLTYNTKPEEETGNIKTIIANITDEYFEILEIVKGKIILNTTDKNLIKIAQSIGIEANPYDIEDGVLLSSENNLLLMDETGTLILPDSVTEIGEGAFSGLEGLKTVIIPGTVKIIGENAFSNNLTLEKVIIQEGVEKIGKKAFAGCRILTNMIIKESNYYKVEDGILYTKDGKTIVNVNANGITGNTFIIKEGVEKVLERAFFICDKVETINIPDKVETIIDWCFSSATKLEQINIGKALKNINASAFIGNKKTLKTVNIDSENPYFTSDENYIYNKDKTKIITFIKYEKQYNIPEGVIELGGGAFHCVNGSPIEQIQLSTTLRDIGNIAFEGCDNLKSITIPNNVETIGQDAFSGCTNLQEININKKLNEISGMPWGASKGERIIKWLLD